MFASHRSGGGSAKSAHDRSTADIRPPNARERDETSDGTTDPAEAAAAATDSATVSSLADSAAQSSLTDIDTGAESTWHWSDVTQDDVVAARERIMPNLHRTPLLTSRTLDRMTGVDLGLKAENFQRTGSFKSRGALNAALLLSPEQRARGLVTLSAGNHGQGLAFAGSLVGSRAVVFMPETATPTKIEAIRNYGAEARFSKDMEGIFPIMEAYQREHGLTYVAPFSDPGIIAGQGVVGLEILEDMPDVETIVVPVGGGGLLAGIALTVKSQRPEVRVVGIEPTGSDVVSRSLKSGKPEASDVINTVADGLTAPFAGALTQAIIEHYVDDVVLVEDEDIVQAMRLILARMKVLVEPSGAAALAGLLTGKASAAKGTRAVAIMSGGNVDFEKLKTLL